MTIKKLTQIKGFSNALAAQRKKQYLVALQEFRIALYNVADTAENQFDRARLYTYIAKCYAQYALREIFKNTDALLLRNQTKIEQFQEYLSRAEAAMNMLPAAQARAVKRAIGETRTYLFNTMLDKTKRELVEKSAALIKDIASENFDADVGRQRRSIQAFYQHYQTLFARQYLLYMSHVAFAFAQAAADRGDKAPNDEKVVWYRRAARLIDQALEGFGEDSLVKPAELLFDKWRLLEKIAHFSESKLDKIAVYQDIIQQFTLAKTDRYYHARSTQYAYALFFAQSAHAALAKLLVDDAVQAAGHAQHATSLQQQFALESESMVAEELPLSHRMNMLLAKDQLASLQARAHKNYSYAESDDETMDEEKSHVDSDYEAEADKEQKTAKTAVEIKSRELSLSASHKSVTMSVAGESDDDDDDDDESDDDVILYRRSSTTSQRDVKSTHPMRSVSTTTLVSSSVAVNTVSGRQVTTLQASAAKASFSSSSSSFSFSSSSSISTSALFKLPRPAAREWYTDDNIGAVLDSRLGSEIARKEVIVFNTITSGKVFAQIKARRAEQMLLEARGESVARHFLIPVNIGFCHWVALSVNFKHGFAKPPTVCYADPLSAEVHALIESGFLKHFNVRMVAGPRQRYQHNGFDCGPWVVAILESLAKTGAFPVAAAVDIAARRVDDACYFDQGLNNRSHAVAVYKKPASANEK